MNPMFMTWEGSCISPERAVTPPPQQKGKAQHGMPSFPGGVGGSDSDGESNSGSESDSDTEDSYDEFDDTNEEEPMDEEDMERSFDEAEYNEEEEEEDEIEEEEEEEEYDNEEEEEEEEENEEMECVEYVGSEFFLTSTTCAGLLSAASPTTESSGCGDSCSGSLCATPLHSALQSSGYVEEVEEVEMAFEVDVSDEMVKGKGDLTEKVTEKRDETEKGIGKVKEESTMEQGGAHSVVCAVEGAIKYRTVSNVGVEGSSNDHNLAMKESVVQVKGDAERDVEGEMMRTRSKARTVTEDLTTPVCASRLPSDSSSSLHFVTPDSAVSRNHGVLIPGTTEIFLADVNMCNEKTKNKKNSCVEAASNVKQCAINDCKMESQAPLGLLSEGKEKKKELRRDIQKEREISVHVIGVIQEYVINTYMTELSLACLSNLIATDLQVLIMTPKLALC